MLPDLWRMAARPARSRRGVKSSHVSADVAAVLGGIDHHLQADRWFHDTPYFVEGEATMGTALREVQSAASRRLRLFAHVTWEMCLDGALVRRVGAGDVERVLFQAIDGRDAAARTAAELHHGSARRAAGVEDGLFEGRMIRLLDAVGSFALPSGYADPAGVAMRLAGIRSAFGFAPPTPSERAKWESAIASVEPTADRLVAALLADRSRPTAS
jgi:hypothetical protein